jgi:hypothetical protein
MDADSPPGPYLAVGELVTWVYRVENTGTVEVVDVLVVDDNGTPDDQADDYQCTIASIPPGVVDDTSCVQVGEVEPGQYANLATAEGTSVGIEVTDLDPSHYFGALPGIQLEKHTNGQDADVPPGPYILVGDAVLWEYIVTNTGNVPLTGITVTDDQDLEIDCPKSTLDPGESMTCHAGDNAQPGQYRNVGMVESTPPAGPAPIDDDASHYFGALVALDLEKLTNGVDADIPPGPIVIIGEPVTWTYQVNNTGNITLAQVVVADDQGVEVTCPGVSLLPGEAMICQAGEAAVEGQYANQGDAVGTPLVGGLPDASDTDPSHYLGSPPGLALETRTNGQDADDPPGALLLVGEPVTWTYHVSNTIAVTLSQVAVSDDQGAAVTCPGDELAPGAGMVCRATGTAAPGVHGNVGTAVATLPLGGKVRASDPSHYLGGQPAINLEKLTNGEDADDPPGPTISAGDTVLWSYVITNTGTVRLTDVVVWDDRGIGVSCPGTSLDPGEHMVCTGDGAAVAGPYENLATVQAFYGTTLVSDADYSHYLGLCTSFYIYLPLVMR